MNWWQLTSVHQSVNQLVHHNRVFYQNASIHQCQCRPWGIKKLTSDWSSTAIVRPPCKSDEDRYGRSGPKKLWNFEARACIGLQKNLDFINKNVRLVIRTPFQKLRYYFCCINVLKIHPCFIAILNASLTINLNGIFMQKSINMFVKIGARILIFSGTDFHFPSTSVPSGTFLRLCGRCWV